MRILLCAWGAAAQDAEAAQLAERPLPQDEVEWLLSTSAGPTGLSTGPAAPGGPCVRHFQALPGDEERTALLHGLEEGWDVVATLESRVALPEPPLPELIAALLDHDLVMGSRYFPGGGVAGAGPAGRALCRAGSALARPLLRLSIHDPSFGLRCWRGSALRRLSLETLRARGLAARLELAWRAERAGLRVGEVPLLVEALPNAWSAGATAQAVLHVLRLSVRLSPYRRR